MDDAAPPAKAPHYDSGGWFRMGSDAPQFTIDETPDGPRFAFLDPDRGDDPVLASRYHAGEIVRAAASTGRWTTSSGWKADVSPPTRFGDAHLAAFQASHPGKPAAHGTLRAQAHPSGWVRVDVFIAGACVFTGFLDRVWEEFGIWPPGSSGEGEPPGRISKRMNWAGFDVAAWPQIAPIAHEGGVLIHEGDALP